MWWQRLRGWLAACGRVLAACVDTRPGSGPPWDDEWDSMPGDEFPGQDI